MLNQIREEARNHQEGPQNGSNDKDTHTYIHLQVAEGNVYELMRKSYTL